jgi:formylglycine-generating enzyme required for sulfatase activity
MGKNPSFHKGNSNYPVENITWHDCMKFINVLNSDPKWEYSLPTEAQWEFAAKGGNKSMGYKYSGSNNIDEVAWNLNNCKADRILFDYFSFNRKPSVVGLKQANELGIYDMSGNVWEFCESKKRKYDELEIDSDKNIKKKLSVLRGGSYDFTPNYCRVSCRIFYYGGDKNIGLRLVLNMK